MAENITQLYTDHTVKKRPLCLAREMHSVCAAEVYVHTSHLDQCEA